MELQLIASHTESVPAQEVARKLRERGYVVLTARSRQTVSLESTPKQAMCVRHSMSIGQVQVLYKNQRYLTHCLANSRTLFDLMTRSWCFDVMKAHFGADFA